MDQELLVEEGHNLIEACEKVGIIFKACLWFNNQDVGDWRLWIVPKDKIKDEHDFYRKIAVLLNDNRRNIKNINISNIELVDADHPVIKFLQGFFEVVGRSTVQLNQSSLNGFYVPHATILLYKHNP